MPNTTQMSQGDSIRRANPDTTEKTKFKMLTSKNPAVQSLTETVIKEQRQNTSIVTVGHFSPLSQSLLTLCRTSLLSQGVTSAPAADIFKWIIGYLNLLGSDHLKQSFLNEIPNQRSLGRHLSAAAAMKIDRIGMQVKADKYGNRRYYLFRQDAPNTSWLNEAEAAKNIQLLATGKQVVE